MNYLFYRLVMYINTSSKDNIDYTIANFILNNIAKIADMNIVVLAKKCHVSPASISRFCRVLGFDDYAHLKIECAKFTTSKLSEYVNDSMIQCPEKEIRHHLTTTAHRLLEQIDLIDLNAMDNLIKAIEESNTTSFFGSHFSHSVAQLLQTALLTTGKFSNAKIDLDQQIKLAQSLTKDDLVIILSVRGAYLTSNPRLQRAIKNSHAKTFLITANHDQSLIKQYDHVLYISSTDELDLGRHMLLSYCEILATKYVSQYNKV